MEYWPLRVMVRVVQERGDVASLVEGRTFSNSLGHGYAQKRSRPCVCGLRELAERLVVECAGLASESYLTGLDYTDYSVDRVQTDEDVLRVPGAADEASGSSAGRWSLVRNDDCLSVL